MIAAPISLSVVVPVYNGSETIGRLVSALESLRLPAMEVILVNDCSEDNSLEVARQVAEDSSLPVTVVDHARNYGEHNALMTGFRHSRGQYVITMDDDLQNPPEEVTRLYEFAQESKADVIYTYFDTKEHAPWRNLGSWLANQTANWVLDKPGDIYLSSFRCLRKFIVDEIVKYRGPFPYVDGLIYQVTKRTDVLQVEHRARESGESNYTIRRLLRLWFSILVNFSTLPLRVGAVFGGFLSVLAMLGGVYVLVDYLVFGTEVQGWASLMLVVLMFSGVQLVVLGLLGEYVGRIFVTVNDRPQTAVRSVDRYESEYSAPRNVASK